MSAKETMNDSAGGVSNAPQADSWCSISGRVVTGRGEGRNFVDLPWAREQFRSKLRIDPFPGTLNIRVEESKLNAIKKNLERDAIVIVPPDRGGCRAFALPAIFEDSSRVFAVIPQVEGYYRDVLELIAAEELRKRFSSTEGTPVRVKVGLKLPGLRRRISGVIVDMDGTLVNTLVPFFESIAAALARGGRPGLSITEVCEMLNAGYDLARILERAGVRGETQTREYTRMVRDEFRERKASEVKLIPRVLEALQLLRQTMGLKLGLATGSTAPKKIIVDDLTRFGLLGLFDSVTTGDEVQSSKPSPELIQESIRRVGIPPASCLVVGDATMDIIAGREAGCATAALLTGVGSRGRLVTEEPDFVESDLFRLAERLVLEGWT